MDEGERRGDLRHDGQSVPEQLPWGRCTKKVGKDGTTLYLHVFDWLWPKDGKLVVPALKNQVVKAYLLKPNWLGWHKKLKTVNVGFSQAHQPNVTISVPKNAPDRFSSTIVLKFQGEPKIYLPGSLTD